MNNIQFEFISPESLWYTEAKNLRYTVFYKPARLPETVVCDEKESISTHLVCTDGRRLLGYGRLTIEGEIGQISQLAVVPDERKRGIGKGIMAALIKEAAQEGAKKIFLNARTAVIPFYLPFGFEATGAIFPSSKTGIPHRRMEKNLNTVVYFVRHAAPDFSEKRDAIRPLTAEGKKEAEKLKSRFKNIYIDAVYSSPYLRAMDTVRPIAEDRQLPIQLVDDFRERKISDGWIENFGAYSQKQWEDFDYKMPEGESLRDVQNRTVSALKILLSENRGSQVIIGSHGTALSALLNHYDSGFDYHAFEAIKNKMPWVVKCTFDGEILQKIEPE